MSTPAPAMTTTSGSILGSSDIAQRRGAEVVFRDEPMRIRVDLDGIATSDRHDLRCAFDCSIRVADSSADRRLLAEVLLNGEQTLTRDGVVRHLARKLAAGANDFASKHPAGDLTGGGATRDALLESIRQAADAAAFACGLIVLPPFALEVESPSLQRQTIESIQRARAEERAAGQVEHLRRAGELLRQFQDIRGSSSTIAPGAVLQQIAPADRGSTLEALLLAASHAEQQATLWAVAGPYLVRIDTGSRSAGSDSAGSHSAAESSTESPSMQLVALPPTLGPLRSVQSGMIDGKRVLLIGARDGIMLLDPDGAPESARLLRSPTTGSQLGFNRVVVDDGTLRASHGEYGVMSWNLEDGQPISPTSRPPAALPPTALPPNTLSPQSARHLQLLASRAVLFSNKDGLFLMNDDEPAGRLEVSGVDDVSAIVLDPSRAFVICTGGTIATIDRSTRQLLDSTRRAGRICSAAALPWLGSIRLLLARDDGPIECVGPDDQLVTQYLSPHRGCKMLAASAELVAAVSADRQRLILWRSWDGRRPFADLHITAQARHRIADIDFA